MRSRYRVGEPDRAHFDTSTIVRWIPVFTSPACCDILVESFCYCREHKGLRLHGWMIMDNHFHAIATAPELSSVMSDLKKFTARRLLEQVTREGRGWLLALLAAERAPHKAGSRHQVWQEGFHPQAIQDDAMMLQSRAERDRLADRPARRGPPEGGINLDYLHLNPVRRGWVTSPEHWRYSSAHEWLPGGSPMMRCDPWR